MPHAVRPSVRLALATFTIAAGLPSALLAVGGPISPYLVGNNFWEGYARSASAAETSPPDEVVDMVSATGIRLVRIGGWNFEVINFPTNSALEVWTRRIRERGAEPIIQVSRYLNPLTRDLGAPSDSGTIAARARETVRYLNTQRGLGIKYWSIGNEPFGTGGRPRAVDVTALAPLFRQVSAAMKAEDPTIRIHGINNNYYDEWVYERLLGGEDDISGPIPGTNLFYLDGVTWHSYPQNDAPITEGIRTLSNFTGHMRADIIHANGRHGRTGESALRWGIGEFNSRSPNLVRQFENGQMFAAVYGLAMHHGATYACAWSLRENGTASPRDFSFSLTEGVAQTRRASYWHTQFIGRHFRGHYLAGFVNGLSVFDTVVPDSTRDALPILFGSIEGDQIAAIILNRSSADLPYVLHLNRDETTPPADAPAGATRLNLDASLPREARNTLTGTLPPHSTELILLRPETIQRTLYRRSDYMNLPAGTSVTATNPAILTNTAPAPSAPTARPDATLFNDFRGGFTLAGQRYWTTATLQGGNVNTVADGLELKAPALAFAQGAIIGQTTQEFNFFQRGFALRLEDFRLVSDLAVPAQANFRLCLVSNSARSNDADDALVLRLTPEQLQLAIKTNSPGTLAELRPPSDTDVTVGPFFALPIAGKDVTGLTFGLLPLATDPATGITTVRCTVELRGAFGTVRHETEFRARAADWGPAGEAAPTLEAQRRDAGTPAASVSATIGRISRHRLTLDEFTSAYGFTDDPLWTPLLVGAESTATRAAGDLILIARGVGQASATAVTQPSARFNFFRDGYTVDLPELALQGSGTGIGTGPSADETVLRLSLCSTAARAFTSPDALTLRLTPNRVLLGLKVDAPASDAERLGASGSAALENIPLPANAVPTSLRLALRPAGGVAGLETIFYALRIGLASGGPVEATGSFTVNRAAWGDNGDSALSLEARLFSNRTNLAGTQVRARLGAVHFTPWVDDLFASAPSFDAWRLRHLSPALLADPVESGALGKLSDSGLSNLLAYALGRSLAPVQGPEATGPALQVTPDGRPLLSFTRIPDPRLIYRVQASEDLATWRDVATSQGPANANGLFEVAYPGGPAPEPRAFLRLQVTR